MPSKSANNATVESQQSATVGSSGSGRNSVADNPTDSQSLSAQIMGVIQHKWRNLEKRKKKLDEYNKMGAANLKADQAEALSHFGEVVHLLDMLADMRKQFETTFTEYETQQRRQAKREKVAQRQRDMERMREILEIRLVLNTLGDENVRAELRRAHKVSDAELVLIDKFYELVEPTIPSSLGPKSDQFFSSASDTFERVLRREEKPLHEKQTYGQLRLILSRLYNTISESPSTKTTDAPNKKEDQKAPHAPDHVVVDEHFECQRPANHKQSGDVNPDHASHLGPTSPQRSNVAADANRQVPPPKLEEIVKPGSFSFLQESQISSGGNQHQRAAHREYVNSNNPQDQGPWLHSSPGKPIERVETVEQVQVFDERAVNAAPWANRAGPPMDANQHRDNFHGVPAEGGAHPGNRNRDQRGGGRQQQHQQQQRNRRPFVPSSGIADENNEVNPNWQADDADFSEWKPTDAAPGQNRATETGGWISGNDSRRRGGGSGRGGRGSFHRGGGGGQNAGGFGDNRRHYNRGHRGPANQQPRSATTVGGGASTFAE